MRTLITRYLEAMQRSDAETIRALSAPGARLEYPGAVEFHSPEELFEWVKGRHGWVRHDFEHFDAVVAADETVVYVTGTLTGAWNGGEPFSAIRFIYRFRTRNEHVLDTRLWSDVAEVLRRRMQASAISRAPESPS